MRSKNVLVAISIFLGAFALASLPGTKRTILTSGDLVHTVRYQIGQSTVLYFGFKPETVICGNKNYFNIEKIKDGLTIQPLSNFSTNLTVINGDKRFLFYLTPAGNSQPDGFIEMKWIPSSETLTIQKSSTKEAIKALSQTITFEDRSQIKMIQLHTFNESNRNILEYEVKNKNSNSIKTNSIEVTVSDSKGPIASQTSVWEKDSVDSKNSVKGRIIFGRQNRSSFNLSVRYERRTYKIFFNGGNY